MNTHTFTKEAIPGLDPIYRGLKSMVGEPGVGTAGKKLKSGLNWFADRSEIGNDMRKVYRSGRDWYYPSTIDPKTKVLQDTLSEQINNPLLDGATRSKMQERIASLGEASIKEQRDLKRDIVMAGLLPPTAMGLTSLGATFVTPPVYDYTKAKVLGGLQQKDAAYDQGFIDKCAEYGVDPDALLKLALVPMPGAQEDKPDIVKSIPNEKLKRIVTALRNMLTKPTVMSASESAQGK